MTRSLRFIFIKFSYARRLSDFRQAALIKGGLIMAKAWAKAFYSSTAWTATREAYISYKGGLCEMCLLKGRYVPGDTVHHIIHLTPDNINNPEISLSWDNLMLLCRDCHADIHSRKSRRFVVKDDGEVICLT